MDCKKSDEVAGLPMEPLLAEVALPDTAGKLPPVSLEQSEAAETTDEGTAWRDELSARLNRYRARRKAPAPRYPSLNLSFGPIESASRAPVRNSPSCDSISDNALALDRTQPEPPIVEHPPERPAPEVETRPVLHHGHAGAKIIEFPRYAWAPPPPPPDQLAEPVFDRPRILDVPEIAPPAPALGGITIEPREKPEVEKRLGIDIPLQAAPLGLRIVASLVDGVIIAAASAFFDFIFWRMTSIRPPRLQMIAAAAAIPCIFWAAYQYLLIVYSASTPGLRAARLELTRFDGSSTKRSLRRWRVLASYLSAASLGMGYVWVFLDEDALCWHDRITHTYLAPMKPPAKS